jgi:3-methyladenine DNA glycosylase AlkD
MANNHAKRLEEIINGINSASPVIPAQRALQKAGFSFSKEPFEEQLKIWNFAWKSSNNFRTQIHAFFFLEQYINKKELLGTVWQTSVSWQQEVDDWPLCDSLSKINSKALEAYPEEVYQQLVLWNKDANLWKRRQSIVSLLYYSRTKKTYLPFERIATLIAPLLKDQEYYVQKGIGWALRELHNVYPAATLLFLNDNLKDISAIAFTAAAENMSTEIKDDLKAKRRLINSKSGR